MRRNLMHRRPQTVWDFMNEVDSIFNNSWEKSDLEPASFNRYGIQADIEELEESYLLSFDIPGVNKEDIKIDLTEGRLTVSGERKREVRSKKDNGFERIEKSYGKFERSFQLPTQIDDSKVQAHYDNGQLEIMVPKAEVAKPKSIPIESGKGGLFSKLLGKTEDSTEQH